MSAHDEKRDRTRRRVRGADAAGLTVIPAKPRVDFFEDTSEKRVVVYARVSTDSERQLMSYEMQQKYYADYVARHEGWRLVNLYADEGISGTSLKHRDQFNTMIEDCRRGLIDLIVTKSVSRFARNVVDCIGLSRELAELKHPVGIFFENEGIYTLNPDTDFVFHLHSTLAQEESRTKSTAMNSSIEMRFSNGIFLTPPLLGYDNDEDRNLVVNPHEASTVRLIFYLYLSGASTSDIAHTLTALGRRTKPGNASWSPGSVLGVLKNERHYGAVLSRKTWTPSFLNHKSVKNQGRHPQYLKENLHEPIISRDDFVAVQRRIANTKYGGGSLVPRLRAATQGALRGFVAVNPHWGGFSAQDYRNASASALEREE